MADPTPNHSLRSGSGLIPEIYHRPMPPRLSWNWLAFIFGPIWYIARGLWVHATIMVGLYLLSGGILLPFVHVYCGLKGNEDALEFRLQKDNYS